MDTDTKKKGVSKESLKRERQSRQSSARVGTRITQSIVHDVAFVLASRVAKTYFDTLIRSASAVISVHPEITDGIQIIWKAMAAIIDVRRKLNSMEMDTREFRRTLNKLRTEQLKNAPYPLLEPDLSAEEKEVSSKMDKDALKMRKLKLRIDDKVTVWHETREMLHNRVSDEENTLTATHVDMVISQMWWAKQLKSISEYSSITTTSGNGDTVDQEYGFSPFYALIKRAADAAFDMCIETPGSGGRGDGGGDDDDDPSAAVNKFVNNVLFPPPPTTPSSQRRVIDWAITPERCVSALSLAWEALRINTALYHGSFMSYAFMRTYAFGNDTETSRTLSKSLWEWMDKLDEPSGGSSGPWKGPLFTPGLLNATNAPDTTSVGFSMGEVEGGKTAFFTLVLNRFGLAGGSEGQSSSSGKRALRNYIRERIPTDMTIDGGGSDAAEVEAASIDTVIDALSDGRWSVRSPAETTSEEIRLLRMQYASTPGTQNMIRSIISETFTRGDTFKKVFKKADGKPCLKSAASILQCAFKLSVASQSAGQLMYDGVEFAPPTRLGIFEVDAIFAALATVLTHRASDKVPTDAAVHDILAEVSLALASTRSAIRGGGDGGDGDGGGNSRAVPRPMHQCTHGCAACASVGAAPPAAVVSDDDGNHDACVQLDACALASASCAGGPVALAFASHMSSNLYHGNTRVASMWRTCAIADESVSEKREAISNRMDTLQGEMAMINTKGIEAEVIAIGQEWTRSTSSSTSFQASPLTSTWDISGRGRFLTQLLTLEESNSGAFEAMTRKLKVSLFVSILRESSRVRDTALRNGYVRAALEADVDDSKLFASSFDTPEKTRQVQSELPVWFESMRTLANVTMRGDTATSPDGANYAAGSDMLAYSQAGLSLQNEIIKALSTREKAHLLTELSTREGGELDCTQAAPSRDVYALARALMTVPSKPHSMVVELLGPDADSSSQTENTQLATVSFSPPLSFGGDCESNVKYAIRVNGGDPVNIRRRGGKKSSSGGRPSGGESSKLSVRVPVNVGKNSLSITASNGRGKSNALEYSVSVPGAAPDAAEVRAQSSSDGTRDRSKPSPKKKRRV